MKIVKVEYYRVAGQEFDTSEKAMEHVEGLIHKHVQNMLNESGALAKSSIAACEYILKHRKVLAELLSVEPYQERDCDHS